jgi:hypothetical protein
VTVSFSDLWVLVIEVDCYSYGSDCFHCAQSVGYRHPFIVVIFSSSTLYFINV